MKSFKYRGTFKGQDRSRGYRHGSRYELDIALGMYSGKPVYWVQLYGGVGEGRHPVPYASLASLRANWDIDEELFMITTDRLSL